MVPSPCRQGTDQGVPKSGVEWHTNGVKTFIFPFPVSRDRVPHLSVALHTVLVLQY